MQFSRSEFQVPEEPVLLLVDDVFALPDGNVEFFRQLLKTQAVDESSFQDSPVAFVVDVFVYHHPHLAVGVLHWSPHEKSPREVLGGCSYLFVPGKNRI